MRSIIDTAISSPATHTIALTAHAPGASGVRVARRTMARKLMVPNDFVTKIKVTRPQLATYNGANTWVDAYEQNIAISTMQQLSVA